MSHDTHIGPGQPSVPPLTAGPHAKRLGLVAVIDRTGRSDRDPVEAVLDESPVPLVAVELHDDEDS